MKVYRRTMDLFTGGHVLVLGHTGSAKTSLLERIAVKKYFQGFKILCFDLRGECSLYGFPEDAPKIVDMIRAAGQEPRAFKHEVLFPFIQEKWDEKERGIMKKEYPRHNKAFIAEQLEKKARGEPYGWTEWRPFKIPYSSLSTEEFTALMRKVSESGYAVLEMLMSERSVTGLDALLKQLVDIVPKDAPTQLGIQSSSGAQAKLGFHSTMISLLTMLMAVQRKGFISEEGEEITLSDGSKIPAAVDWGDVMRDKETWTTIELKECTSDVKALSYYVIATQITKERIDGGFPPLFPVMPECHQYLPREAKKSMLTRGHVNPAPITEMWLAELRKLDVDVGMDSQSPKKVDTVSLEHFTWFAVGRNAWKREFLASESLPPIDERVLPKFPGLQTGYFWVGRLGDQEYWYPVMGTPMLAKHKERNLDLYRFLGAQKNLDWVGYSAPIQKSVTGGILHLGENKQTAKRIMDAVDKKMKELAISMRKQGVPVVALEKYFNKPGRTLREWVANDRAVEWQ